MKKDKNKLLFKTLLIFVTFLCYVPILNSIFGIFGVSDTIVTSFISDLLYLIFVMYMYKDTISEKHAEFRNNHKFRKRVLLVVQWVIILFAANLLLGILTQIIVPNQPVDDNTTSIYSLSKISFIYTIFKTLLFAAIAEELVFKKSIRDVIDNKVFFIFISSMIYTLVNIAYSDLSSSYILMNSLIYFVPSLILSFMYVKSDDNIYMVMLVKFAYNIIPLSILLLEL